MTCMLHRPERYHLHHRVITTPYYRPADVALPADVSLRVDMALKVDVAMPVYVALPADVALPVDVANLYTISLVSNLYANYTFITFFTK